jgi:xanthine dehydrogenase accessory factor
MDSIDQQVLGQLQRWLQSGHTGYLCTIVKAVGSSPRPVGSLLAMGPEGSIVGSLSGGCVEDDLLEKLALGELAQEAPQLVEYGVDATQNERLGLPCGGRLYVLVEKLQLEQAPQIALINDRLAQRRCATRCLVLASGQSSVAVTAQFEPLSFDGEQLQQTFGPRYLMLLIGAGQLARTLAEIAMMLDYRIVVCDPRSQLIDDWSLPGVELTTAMPDDAVREWVQDQHSIVITLTHDPRIDDMALMEALVSPACYVGALGSVRTSAKRRERLPELGLTATQIGRLHAPVGLGIGSKTPPEIAVAILAELTQLRRQDWRSDAG